MTTALGNPFPCGTALGNPFPCRKVCFAQKAPLDKPPLRLLKFYSRNFLGNFGVFSVFSKDFVGSAGQKILGNFEVSLKKKQKTKEKKDREDSKFHHQELLGPTSREVLGV